MASGDILPLCNHISTQVCIQNMDAPVEHSFVAADCLVAPVILGTDFLRQHELILRRFFQMRELVFTQSKPKCHNKNYDHSGKKL